MENDNYPLSIYIDDLETFLLTLKRKDNFYGELIAYLTTGRSCMEIGLLDELEL